MRAPSLLNRIAPLLLPRLQISPYGILIRRPTVCGGPEQNVIATKLRRSL
jgi:hypothetical protein